MNMKNSEIENAYTYHTMNCKGCMAICGTSKKPNDPTKCVGFIHRTNGNLLRSKSDEELAEKIGESIDCEVCKTMHHSESGECPCRPHQSCVDFWLDWLRQEAPTVIEAEEGK